MKQTVSIIGIPMDLGQQQRGVDMGPVAIRYAGLAPKLRNLGYHTIDHGNVDVPGHYTLSSTRYEERLIPICRACEQAYKLGADAIANGEIPIFLGGDHSASIGTIGGVTDQGPCGLIWVDAHGDFNTLETSASENIHGMSLAILLGRGSKELVDVGRPGAKLAPENVVMIGVRDLDHEEKKLLAQSGCTVYTMRDVDELGMHAVLRKALAGLAGLPGIHLSLDMDAIDPLEAPGVGTPSHGGLTYREAQLIMETLCDSGKLHSVDVMEVNPILDVKNRTAQVAVSLLTSLFGKSII
ncbi:arginase [Desulfopila inferna]|uniref:arginase n=1 Tax=Desulfopila inferna TaxID=468528 RepID=UPI0019660B91|nr:arginase [Desulfopila inferna]MBM9603683.1 arginase [Desulfopila inferna]